MLKRRKILGEPMPKLVNMATAPSTPGKTTESTPNPSPAPTRQPTPPVEGQKPDSTPPVASLEEVASPQTKSGSNSGTSTPSKVSCSSSPFVVYAKCRTPRERRRRGRNKTLVMARDHVVDICTLACIGPYIATEENYQNTSIMCPSDQPLGLTSGQLQRSEPIIQISTIQHHHG